MCTIVQAIYFSFFGSVWRKVEVLQSLKTDGPVLGARDCLLENSMDRKLNSLSSATEPSSVFHCHPQAKMKAICFSTYIHIIEERHLFIPEKQSRALHLLRISHAEVGCGEGSTNQLLPLLHAFHTWLPEHHASWPASVLTGCYFSGFFEIFFCSCWRAPGLSPLFSFLP